MHTKIPTGIFTSRFLLAAVLGSTGNKTADLWEDQRGLFGGVEINEQDQDAKNAYARVDRPMYEVSPCTFPAYTQTIITSRAKVQLEAAREKLENARKERKNQWRKSMKARLKGEKNGT